MSEFVLLQVVLMWTVLVAAVTDRVTPVARFVLSAPTNTGLTVIATALLVNNATPFPATRAAL